MRRGTILTALWSLPGAVVVATCTQKESFLLLELVLTLRSWVFVTMPGPNSKPAASVRKVRVSLRCVSPEQGQRLGFVLRVQPHQRQSLMVMNIWRRKPNPHYCSFTASYYFYLLVQSLSITSSLIWVSIFWFLFYTPVTQLLFFLSIACISFVFACFK